jgi:antagonist of KipI
MHALEVLKPGALTTIQDRGRRSHMRYGVSRCGAMDQFSYRMGNLLAGNADDALPALEVTLLGPRLRAHERIGMAITGADLAPHVGDDAVPMWRFVVLERGQELSFRGGRSGCRAYICFTGGLDVPSMLGSRSTHTRAAIGGLPRALVAGDRLEVAPLPADIDTMRVRNRLPVLLRPEIGPTCVVDVLTGPQENRFTSDSVRGFYDAEYTVTPQSDRMGYRLSGPPLLRIDDAEAITEATPPGAVQVPHDGMPIVLMPDAAVTGGYPKVAVATSVALDRLAQVRPGGRIRFARTDLAAAHRAIRERERILADMRGIFVNANAPWHGAAGWSACR